MSRRKSDIASPGDIPIELRAARRSDRCQADRRAHGRVRSVHAADEESASEFVEESSGRLRCSSAQSAVGRRQAVEESAVPTEAARPGDVSRETYLAKIGVAIGPRHIPADRDVQVSRQRRTRRAAANNPPEPKIGLPPLAVYNPIHYQELPELLMDSSAA